MLFNVFKCIRGARQECQWHGPTRIVKWLHDVPINSLQLTTSLTENLGLWLRFDILGDIIKSIRRPRHSNPGPGLPRSVCEITLHQRKKKYHTNKKNNNNDKKKILYMYSMFI